MVEDRCSGTRRVYPRYDEALLGRFPIERPSVCPGASAAAPLGTRDVEQQSESVIPKPLTCPRTYGDTIKVTGTGSAV